MKITRKELIAVAKLEMKEWKNLPDGLVMAILFAFVHRVTTGETIEETFQLCKTPIDDYEI
jgi:hypothetical protein